jgi:hypothetical protein
MLIEREGTEIGRSSFLFGRIDIVGTNNVITFNDHENGTKHLRHFEVNVRGHDHLGANVTITQNDYTYKSYLSSGASIRIFDGLGDRIIKGLEPITIQHFK